MNPAPKLGERIVRILADGLNNVNILVADGFIGADVDSALGKNMGCGFAEFNAEIITHFLCKRPACGAGKNSYDTVG